MTVGTIKAAVSAVAGKYNISRAVLFGSRAQGSCREDSDVDLIVEFSEPVTLLTLSQLKCELEEMLKLDVDIVHGPLCASDMIEVSKEVLLYAA